MIQKKFSLISLSISFRSFVEGIVKHIIVKWKHCILSSLFALKDKALEGTPAASLLSLKFKTIPETVTLSKKLFEDFVKICNHDHECKWRKPQDCQKFEQLFGFKENGTFRLSAGPNPASCFGGHGTHVYLSTNSIPKLQLIQVYYILVYGFGQQLGNSEFSSNSRPFCEFGICHMLKVILVLKQTLSWLLNNDIHICLWCLSKWGSYMALILSYHLKCRIICRVNIRSNLLVWCIDTHEQCTNFDVLVCKLEIRRSECKKWNNLIQY